MTFAEHNRKRMINDTAALVIALATENAELRAQPAETQELLIETAIDAGEMHGRLEDPQLELVRVQDERDAWQLKVERWQRPVLRKV